MAQVCTQSWPTITITVTRRLNSHSVQEVSDTLMAQFERAQCENTRVRMIFDATALPSAPWGTLPALVQLMLRIKKYTSTLVSGSTILLPSKQWRVWLDRLFAVVPPSAPMHVYTVPHGLCGRLGLVVSMYTMLTVENQTVCTKLNGSD